MACAASAVAAQHRACGQIDGWEVHAGGAKQKAGRGLVAAAHQHDAIDGMAAQQFFRVHRQHVAIEHRCRFQQRFRQRQRRQLHRKAACHQHAALDVVDPALEVHVAGLRVRPGVEDCDDRRALPLLRCITHLHRPRAMAEGAQIVGGEPACAAELVGFLLAHDCVGAHSGGGVAHGVCRTFGFGTIRPMMITVNRPGNAAGMPAGGPAQDAKSRAWTAGKGRRISTAPANRRSSPADDAEVKLPGSVRHAYPGYACPSRG